MSEQLANCKNGKNEGYMFVKLTNGGTDKRRDTVKLTNGGIDKRMDNVSKTGQPEEWTKGLMTEKGPELKLTCSHSENQTELPAISHLFEEKTADCLCMCRDGPRSVGTPREFPQNHSQVLEPGSTSYHFIF